MITLHFNNTLNERDMDLLFAESILTDPGFLGLLLNKTELKGRALQILSAELSKTDSELGESDITVVINVDGIRYGLLIEDKIDAIAMPEQQDRYMKRGEKGVKAGEYDDFMVFLICPERYFWNNDEAKLYENLLTYEECKEYFDSKNDLTSIFRSQQLDQAITKSRKPPVITINEKANAFLKQYIRYQKEHYPSLDLSTKEDRNGWWTDFRTELGSVYLTHKIQQGYVDLTISKASEKIDQVRIITEWARQHKISGAAVVKTKKSAIIRIHVPKIDMEKGFDLVDKDELNQCFDVIKELTDFANIVALMSSLAFSCRRK